MFSIEQFLPILEPFLFLFALFLIFFILKLSLMNLTFQKSGYGKASGYKFLQTIRDTGNYGEYRTFLVLEQLPGENRIMTNLYIPKTDGTTTELDLVLINQAGIYVFESKNYSGWIFGNETSKNWTQSLNRNSKKKFLNPIIQNKGHIGALTKILNDIDRNLFYSYIVFSERCELKKISITSQDVILKKRGSLYRALKTDIDSRQQLLSIEQVNDIYEKLSQFARVDNEVKAKHIEQIQMKN